MAPPPPVPRPPSSTKRRKTRREEQLEFGWSIWPKELDREDVKQAWRDWIDHRAELRKPLTSAAIRRQLAFLAALGPDGAVASIEQSIMNGWQGLFHPRQAPQPASKPAEPASKPEPTIPPLLDTPEFREAWAKWRRYHEEIGRPLTLAMMEEQLTFLAGLGKDWAVVAIKRSMMCGWKRLVDPRVEPNQAAPGSQPGQRPAGQPGGNWRKTADQMSPRERKEAMLDSMAEAIRQACKRREAAGGPPLKQWINCKPAGEDYANADLEDILCMLVRWRERYYSVTPAEMIRYAIQDGFKGLEWAIDMYVRLKDFVNEYLRPVLEGQRLPDEWLVTELLKEAGRRLREARHYAARAAVKPPARLIQRLNELALDQNA
jgi:hypothetical protein